MSKDNRTKNDKVWAEIWHSTPAIEQEIESRGYYDIDSKTIKEFGREPRLACYFDHPGKVPRILQRNGVSVLAIKNGLYRMAKTSTFFNLKLGITQQNTSVKSFKLPSYIQALSADSISSESKALDAALISGMLDYVFNDQDVELILRGREFSGQFEFSLNDESRSNSMRYPIDGVTVEVDGGYEGRCGIHLVEAKKDRREHIGLRQVLYPHLNYQVKHGNHKPVQTYVLFYEPSTFTHHFYQLKFNQTRNSQIEPVLDDFRYVPCRLQHETIHEQDYWAELYKVQVDHSRTDIDRPFPQADDFNRILAIFRKLPLTTRISKDELFREFEIVPRQFDYYGNALRWFRVVDYEGSSQTFGLTDLGRQLRYLGIKEIVFKLAEIALSNDLVNEMFHNRAISTQARYRNNLTSESTYNRRCDTAKIWLRYFKGMLNPSEN